MHFKWVVGRSQNKSNIKCGLNTPEISTIQSMYYSDYQGPDFNDMSYFFPCEIDDEILY